MDWLDTQYYGNTVGNWLLASGIIVGSFAATDRRKSGEHLGSEILRTQSEVNMQILRKLSERDIKLAFREFIGN